MGFKACFARTKLIGLTTWGIFSYYNAIYPNYQVMIDYVYNEQYGYCAVTGLAILFSLLAQTFYSKKLMIYEDTTFCIAAFISIIYCTPLLLFISFVKWQCQKGVNNEKKYEHIIDGDMERIGLITNFFEAPILICIQISIVGQYILYSSQTRSDNDITYPATDIEFAWLLYACLTSFRGLSDGAWTRISDMVQPCKGPVEGRSKLCRTILFR